MSLENLKSDQETMVNAVINLIHSEFEDSGYFLTDTTRTFRDGVYHIMLELMGFKLYTREELDQLRIKLSDFTKDKMEIYVLSRPKVVLSKDGYTNFN